MLNMERAIRYIRTIALLGVMSMYFGCTQKSAQLQKGIAPPDKTLFETGETYLKRGQYLRSRLALQTLLNTYPDSDIASDAYFAMGDTYYEEGGTENLLLAENQYKNFITFFRGDPREAEAQMKIISLHIRMMNTPDRDPQHAYNALREIKVFELKYPDHDYIPIIKRIKIDVEDNLARGDLAVADFYLKNGKLLGAMQRLEHITENFKNFEEMDTVMFRIGELYDRIKAPDAAIWYGKIAEAYPFSRHYEAAKKRLTDMGYEIPKVNETLAAANQANIKPPAGFSPIRPLLDFVEALGFITPPDPYETARKTVEEDKAREAAKAGAGTGDDILITSTIRRDASGAPVDETSSPSDGSGESPDSAPGSGDGANQPGGAAKRQNAPSRYQRKPQQK